jgi:hypothetical protein
MAIPRKRTKRELRIRAATVSTVLGCALLTAGAVWLEQSRSTDLADSRVGVSQRLREGGVDVPPIRFVDVGRDLGVVDLPDLGARSHSLPEDTGSGLAWGDYDGDGDPDLYVVAMPGSFGAAPASGAHNRLFENQGDRFEEVSERAGVDDPEGFGMGASWADYDDDGHLDLYVTNHGPNRLFRNRGDGRFEEVGREAGVDDPLWSTGATWGDYDRDGLLDLYVVNYLAYDHDELSGLGDAMEEVEFPFTLNPNSFEPRPNRLYRNLGNGRFEDVAAIAGVANPQGRSLAATFCDLDGDGWLDLYVNNDVSANALYQSLGRVGGGADSPVLFRDIAAGSGTADPRGSMGLSVVDLPDAEGLTDLLPDLFITHWVAQENALYRALRSAPGRVEYRDLTRALRLGEVSTDTVGWGSLFTDLDLDGRPDLVVANGSTLQQKEDPKQLKAEPMFVFWNSGERFVEIAGQAGDVFERRYHGRGLAGADFDHDGDMDLAVAINRATPLLLRNDSDVKGRSLSVDLDAPSHALFGARVRVTVEGRSQTQWYGADASYLSQHGHALLFGIGSATEVERISVRFNDGTEVERTRAAAGSLRIPHPDRN